MQRPRILSWFRVLLEANDGDFESLPVESESSIAKRLEATVGEEERGQEPECRSSDAAFMRSHDSGARWMGWAKSGLRRAEAIPCLMHPWPIHPLHPR